MYHSKVCREMQIYFAYEKRASDLRRSCPDSNPAARLYSLSLYHRLGMARYRLLTEIRCMTAML